MRHSRIGVPTLLMMALLLAEATSDAVRVAVATDAAEEKRDELSGFFRKKIGLSGDQIKAIRSGQSVAKVLDSPTADQVFVFGAVYVRSTPEEYLKLASDIDALK